MDGAISLWPRRLNNFLGNGRSRVVNGQFPSFAGPMLSPASPAPSGYACKGAYVGQIML